MSSTIKVVVFVTGASVATTLFVASVQTLYDWIYGPYYNLEASREDIPRKKVLKWAVVGLGVAALQASIALYALREEYAKDTKT